MYSAIYDVMKSSYTRPVWDKKIRNDGYIISETRFVMW